MSSKNASERVAYFSGMLYKSQIPFTTGSALYKVPVNAARFMESHDF